MVEPVARIFSIASKIGRCRVTDTSGFPSGIFRRIPRSSMKLKVKVPNPKVLHSGVLVFRGNTFAVASNNTTLCVGDFVQTSSEDMCAIEFLIGGRVGVNYSTIIEIVNERAVADGDNGFFRFCLKNGFLWLRDGETRILEIQTAGGTMAIKG